MISSNTIRQRFLDFFKKRDHYILNSAPLLPESNGEGRNVTLFNVAGMQPLMHNLLGEPHPQGGRLASSQKCIRTVDIEEVGDNTHATFFEMLGNWSLGDYYKKESITWSYEFLTNTDEGLGLDPARIYVTVFSGNDMVPQDDEAVAIWKDILPKHRIYYRDGKDNWWSAGSESPAGPSTEIFYDTTADGLGDLTPQEFEDADERQDVVEIWNNVFMEYDQQGGVVAGPLPQKNVDTGAGLERMTALMQGVQSIYDTDLFTPLLAKIKEHADITTPESTRSARIIADHIKTAVFLMAEGLEPSSTGAGYVLRRLIRRALVHKERLGITDTLSVLIDVVANMYNDIYPECTHAKEKIYEVYEKEVTKFSRTLSAGMKAFEKGERDAFILFTTYGFPLEMSEELAIEKGETIDRDAFFAKMEEHKQSSRKGAEQKFKGGLSDSNDPRIIKLHTAHHLLLAALQSVLGSHVKQRGSNITTERLRIDFMHGEKMTPEQKKEVEDLVNEYIQKDLPVIKKIMPKTDAEALGAEMEFGQKYPDTVTVYFVGEGDACISKEFCGGPHVDRTGDLGVFRIKKEESSSAGVRRIKAVLE